MTYASTILTDNPTCYLPLTESGVAIGSVYADATGHGYDVSVVTGTLSHIAGPVAGETAPDFPGAPGYDGLLGSVTAGLPVDGQPYSLEGWVKPERTGYWMSWFAYGPPGNTGPFIGSDMHANLGAGTGTTQLEFWNPSNGSAMGTSQNIVDGSWHYLVLTDDAAGTQNYYLDGVLVATQAVGTSNGLVYASTNVLAIGDSEQAGTRYAPAGEAYTGGLAHMAIYPTALTAAQVAAHYAAATYVPVANLALTGTSGVVGSTVGVNLYHFAPSTACTVTFNGSAVATGTTDTYGALTVNVTVPSVTVSASTVAASDGTHSASAPFTVIFETIILRSLVGQGKGRNGTYNGVSWDDPPGWMNPGYDDSAWEGMVQETNVGADYVADPDGGGTMWATKLAGSFWIVPPSLNGDLGGGQPHWLHRRTFTMAPIGGTITAAYVQVCADNFYSDIWINGHDTMFAQSTNFGSEVAGALGNRRTFDHTWLIPGGSNLFAILLTSSSGPTSVDYQLVVQYTVVPTRTPRNQVYWKT